MYSIVHAHRTWKIQIVAAVLNEEIAVSGEFPQETQALELDVNHVHYIQTDLRLTILKKDGSNPFVVTLDASQDKRTRLSRST